MNENMLGPIMVLGFSAIGSVIGCYIAGAASHAAMARVEEGHGKFIGFSAVPASQALYGCVLMILMRDAILAGTLSAGTSFAMGLFAGLAFLASSVFQGRVCATGIQACIKEPSLFGKCFASIGIIESFALFVLVFSLQLL